MPPPVGPGGTGKAQSYVTTAPSGPSSTGPNFSNDLQLLRRETEADQFTPTQNLNESLPSPSQSTSASRLARQSDNPNASVGVSNEVIQNGNSAQSNRMSSLERDIWEMTLDAISQYENHFFADILDAANEFAVSESESIATGDVSSKAFKTNLGYALISRGTNAAVDVMTPKTGEPLGDTMNVLAHTLNNSNFSDWSLSAALTRVNDVRQAMTGYFKSDLDAFAEQFKAFSANRP